jgi:hypothetical protein
MGYADAPKGKVAFAVCRACGEIPEAEREQKVLDKISFKPMAHCGSA